jgi:hypothetical protein
MKRIKIILPVVVVLLIWQYSPLPTTEQLAHYPSRAQSIFVGATTNLEI